MSEEKKELFYPIFLNCRNCNFSWKAEIPFGHLAEPASMHKGVLIRNDIDETIVKIMNCPGCGCVSSVEKVLRKKENALKGGFGLLPKDVEVQGENAVLTAHLNDIALSEGLNEEV